MTAEEKVSRPKFTDYELLYAAVGRCRCGAGLAYPLDHDYARELRAWVCSRVLKEETEGPAYRKLPFGADSVEGEHDAFDWAFYKVREESSVNNEGGFTTRPSGTICKEVGMAACPKCQHKWESEPYVAHRLGHHWRSGPCPGCGLDHGGDGCSDSRRGPAIEMRFRHVVVVSP